MTVDDKDTPDKSGDEVVVPAHLQNGKLRESFKRKQYHGGSEVLPCAMCGYPPPPEHRRGRSSSDAETAAKVVRRINVDRMFRKSLTILTREIEALMVASYKNKLTREEASQLVDYIKLSNELNQLTKLDKVEKKIGRKRRDEPTQPE